MSRNDDASVDKFPQEHNINILNYCFMLFWRIVVFNAFAIILSHLLVVQ